MDEELKKEVVRNFSKASDMVMDPIKQRMSHPLASSFVLSWILFNWRPIFYFILAPDSIKEKIAFISVNFYSNGLWNMLYYLIVPLGLSLIYIGLFDRISNKINKFKEQDILDKYAHEKKIGVEKYNSQREIMVARRALNNVTSDNHTIEQLNLQIEALKSENAKKDEHLTLAQLELEKRAEALVKITEQRDSIDTKLFEVQEELIDKIRTFNSNLSEKDAIIATKEDEIIRLNQGEERAKVVYDDLVIREQELLNSAKEVYELKNTLETLITTMSRELKRDQFISIISKISFVGLSNLLRELTEKEYTRTTGKKMQKYRRVFTKSQYVNYEYLNDSLMKIDENIMAYELIEEGNKVLEIAYPHNVSTARVVGTLDTLLNSTK